MKKILYTLLVISLFWGLAGCLSIPEQRKAYEGAVRPNEQLSHFYMSQGWNLKLVLYKVDGKYCSCYYPQSISYTDWKGGFNVALLPGSHNFELLIQE